MLEFGAAGYLLVHMLCGSGLASIQPSPVEFNVNHIAAPYNGHSRKKARHIVLLDPELSSDV